MQNPLGRQEQNSMRLNRTSNLVAQTRSRMTLMITYLLTAELIARQDFPQKLALPKLYPPAFNNFGHQLLLDYQLLLAIVWEVVEEIKIAVEKWQDKKLPWVIGILALGITLLLIGFLNFTAFPFLLLLALLGLPALYRFVTARIQKSMKRDVAEIRAEAIRNLMKGEWKSDNEDIRKTIARDLKKIGDGVLDGAQVPVITVIDDEQPFSGYGRLQAENLFICRPKEKANDHVRSEEEIRKTVANNIVEKVLGLGISGISFGDVAVIQGDSLTRDSKWLDEEKTPILWLDRYALGYVREIDPRASARTYFAAQVLFAQYMTVATFFVRIFWAGHSASCSVAVTTLGPPGVDWDYLNVRLMKHEREKEEETQPHEIRSAFVSKEEQDALGYLTLLRAWSQDKTPFQANLDAKEIKKLSITADNEARREEYEKEFKRVLRQSVMWPGSYYKLFPNWRENNSFTFTTDFFGRPEAIASVRALYDQISRTALDTLDTLGFDISDYRDKEGKYSINAEKIDQLVVGERVHIDQSAQVKKTEQSKTPAKEQAAQSKE